jgi:anti-sigma B factor antagonist
MPSLWVLIPAGLSAHHGAMPQATPRCDSTVGGITVAMVEGEWVMRLSGEIDSDVIAACGDVSSTTMCGAHTFEPQITTVDLTDVTYLSSAGLGFLLRQTEATRRAGRMPVLLGATRPARRMMELTGVDRLFVPAA